MGQFVLVLMVAASVLALYLGYLYEKSKPKLILAALAQHGELSSYQLGKITRLGMAIYPVIYRMEDDGRVVSRRGQATLERGGNRPRLYSIPHND